MNPNKLYKGLGTAGLSIAVTAALLHIGGGLPGSATDEAAVNPPDAFPPGVQLPAVPEMVQRAGLDGDLEPLVERWNHSWTSGDESDRLAMYGPISERLTERLDPDAVYRELDRIRAAVEEGRRFDAAFLPAALVRGLDRADSLEIEARALLAEGLTAEAIAAALAAADALRVVAPQEVAERLTARAENALRRIQDGAAYSEVQARRGERLTLGARQAMDDGEYERAFQRAYYACQLLESEET